ncbi:HlyD family efflux transporter periplasmic adaptor subunit [Erysipelothrix urinaevulpis]|uniref:HlyD family efflux transporter periplasmic adaptor subunit n=1 Tax=Erysipelothrix urinaevulpis TaxID=2683717 RepID=UPI00135BB383|nr:HlyD family efflux transporter periplasmic adaptor subunit [Erysipelothrix urinaevulpis]
MKLYSKEHLHSSRIFFDKRPPKFGLAFTIFITLLMITALFTSTMIQKTYIVKAQGCLKSSDLEYVSSNVNGGVIEVLKKEGEDVKKGDVIMLVSDGKETLEIEAYLTQVKHLKEKIKIMDKYQSSLEQEKNLMKNKGLEQEYYAYLEYYLGEKKISNVSNQDVKEELKKKETALKKEKEKYETLKEKVSKITITDHHEKLDRLQRQITENQETLNELKQKENPQASFRERISKLTKQQKSLSFKYDEIQKRMNLEENDRDELEKLKSEVETKQDEVARLEEQVTSPVNKNNSMHAQMLMELGKNRTQVETRINELESSIKLVTDQTESYKIKTNQSGKLHYLRPMHVGLSLQQNQVVAEVSTSNPDLLIAEAYINAHDISRVDIMQDVKVAMNGVNSTKYGTLQGTLVEIDSGTITQETPEGNLLLYKAKVALNETELKNKDEVIKAIPSMPIEARIIYEKESYFDWLLEKLNFQN